MISHLNVRKNVITTVIAFFLNIALTFLGYKLLLERDGLEVLGLWSILTAAIFIIRVGDVGMGASAERYIALLNLKNDKSLKIKEYLDTALIVNTSFFIFLSILGYFLIENYIDKIIPNNLDFQNQAIEILPIMIFTFLISNMANVLLGGVRGLHLGYIAAYISIICNVVQLLLFIVLVPKYGILGLAIGQLFQNIFIMILSQIVIYYNMKQYLNFSVFSIKVSKVTLKELLGFSLKTQFVNIINGMFEPISKFMIGHTAGMSALGVYELAYKMVSLPRNAVVSGVMGTMPAITRLLSANLESAQNLYLQSKKIVNKVVGLTMLLVMLGSPLASHVLLDKVNFQLICYSCILAIGFYFNAIGSPAYTLGFSAAKLKGNILAASLSIILLLLVTLLLFKIIPNYASIIASGLGLAISGLYVLVHNEKILGLKSNG